MGTACSLHKELFGIWDFTQTSYGRSSFSTWQRSHFQHFQLLGETRRATNWRTSRRVRAVKLKVTTLASAISRLMTSVATPHCVLTTQRGCHPKCQQHVVGFRTEGKVKAVKISKQVGKPTRGRRSDLLRRWSDLVKRQISSKTTGVCVCVPFLCCPWVRQMAFVMPRWEMSFPGSFHSFSKVTWDWPIICERCGLARGTVSHFIVGSLPGRQHFVWKLWYPALSKVVLDDALYPLVVPGV